MDERNMQKQEEETECVGEDPVSLSLMAVTGSGGGRGGAEEV